MIIRHIFQGLITEQGRGRENGKTLFGSFSGSSQPSLRVEGGASSSWTHPWPQATGQAGVGHLSCVRALELGQPLFGCLGHEREGGRERENNLRGCLPMCLHVGQREKLTCKQRRREGRGILHSSHWTCRELYSQPEAS